MATQMVNKSMMSVDVAKGLMGDDFVGLGIAQKYFGRKRGGILSKNEINSLSYIRASEDIFRTRGGNFILAVVPGNLSILDMKNDMSLGGYNLFTEPRDFPEYGDLKADKDVVDASVGYKSRWCLLRKTGLPDSDSWFDINRSGFLPDGYRTPSARVVVYVMLAYYLKTGKWLFEGCNGLRTSDTDLSGKHPIIVECSHSRICVSISDAEGLGTKVASVICFD